MKKLILTSLLFIVCAGSNHVAAQKDPGIFNNLSVGVNLGTNGIGIDAASTIGKYFAVRGGFSFMPDVSFNSDVDVDFEESIHVPYVSSINVKGELGRTAGELLLNVYPFPSSSFFLCGGAYFGGGKLIKMSGHSDELERFIEEGGKAGIAIGDYAIPVDEHGNVAGGLKVSSFRPYVGLGFGRAVPKKRIGFMFELGVQFHKTPEVYAKGTDLTVLNESISNDLSDIMDYLVVYPVIKFRLCGRIL